MLESDLLATAGPPGPGGFPIQLPPISDRLQGSYLEWRLRVICIRFFSLKLIKWGTKDLHLCQGMIDR